MYENVVASELRAHGYELCYYDNKKHGEVDFLVDNYDILSTMPIEVKSGKDSRSHSSLDRLTAVPDYNIKKGIVLSNNREVVTDGLISYMPVYYVMFLRPSNPVQYML